MKIIVACERYQRICKAFRELGHEAYSNDLVPTEGNPEWHIQGNILDYLDAGWDMMIANPPCPYLANSGVRWLIGNQERYEKMVEACRFFNTLLDAPIPLIAIENPIQHKYARQFIRKPDQIIQPYHFGDRESKATCLWLKGLPPLLAYFTGGEGIMQSVYRQPPAPNRGMIRSKTFDGIAKAMAEQWGNRVVVA